MQLIPRQEDRGFPEELNGEGSLHTFVISAIIKPTKGEIMDQLPVLGRLCLHIAAFVSAEPRRSDP